MLKTRAQPVARVPPAHPQLLSLVIGHKPVVRLLLLRSADVARYSLPDHRISPCPHSPCAAGPIPVFPLIPKPRQSRRAINPRTAVSRADEPHGVIWGTSTSISSRIRRNQ